MALIIDKKILLPVNTQSLISRTHSLLQDYLAISKFKVVAMLVLTAWVGLALAPDVGRGMVVQFISLLGIGLLSAAAAVINHVVDSEIDSKMARTRHRPVAKGRLSKTHALSFAAVIGVAGFIMLMVWANTLNRYINVICIGRLCICLYIIFKACNAAKYCYRWVGWRNASIIRLGVRNKPNGSSPLVTRNDNIYLDPTTLLGAGYSTKK